MAIMIKMEVTSYLIVKTSQELLRQIFAQQRMERRLTTPITSVVTQIDTVELPGQETHKTRWIVSLTTI